MDWDLRLSHYKQRPFKEIVKELAEFVFTRIQETQLNQVASSLTLTTVLSLVPLLAVILVSFAVFPAFEARRAEMEQLLFFKFAARSLQSANYRLCEVLCRTRSRTHHLRFGRFDHYLFDVD